MSLEIHWILSILLLGSFVGFMAGLLSIGGGEIMVPVLTTLFLYQGIPGKCSSFSIRNLNGVDYCYVYIKSASTQR